MQDRRRRKEVRDVRGVVKEISDVGKRWGFG